MEDEDEIDVLGEFNLENLLTKNEDQLSSCYDGDQQLGLHCDSPWMLDSTAHTSWYDHKSEQHNPFGCTPFNSTDSLDSNSWSDKEKYLLEKGLELFGRSWSRLAQYIGTKNSSQVKIYVKSEGVGWPGKSVSTSSFGVDNIDLNFSELIDDMEIPASMEEVIAAVSTAQPTVVLPSSQREALIVPNRRMKCRRKRHHHSGSKRKHFRRSKHKETTQIYHADEIKDVLTENKEHDSIVLPNGEQVMRIRHGSSLSEESDVDIDIDSDLDKIKGNLAKEENAIPNKTNAVERLDQVKLESVVTEVVEEDTGFYSFKDENVVEMQILDDQCNFDLVLNDIENEVSVFTDGYIENPEENNPVEKDTQVYKGNLITPSGKVMTVIVDDMPSNFPTSSKIADRDAVCGTRLDGEESKPIQSAVSKYVSVIQERLNAVYQLPPPTQEINVESNIVTEEEQQFHPEFFSKDDENEVYRYIKIRNHIIDCWKASKPKYVTKTSVRAGLKNCGDVNLISRIHAYLEQNGYINFGCEQCHYKKPIPVLNCQLDPNEICEEVVVSTYSELEKCVNTPPQVEKRGSGRARKKKLPFEEAYNNTKSNINNVESQEFSQAIKHIQSKKPEGICSTWRSRKKKCDVIPHSNEGDFTLVHSDSGDVVKLQHIQTKPNRVTTRGIKRIKLIHCKNYSVCNKAPYRVEMDVLALLLVDVHSHLSPWCEVIGLLGGVYHATDHILSISMAVPCRTVLSSNTHCDMCPVSQCESSELITGKGLSVVGWYHSHPSFDPSPSNTDIDTQNMLQSWFNKTGKPFVGLIISPYFPAHGASSFRCCQVKTESNGLTPYQLEVKISNLNLKISPFKPSVEAALNTIQKNKPLKQLHIYTCLESIKHHLRRASPKVEEEKASQVLHELRDFFKSLSVK